MKALLKIGLVSFLLLILLSFVMPAHAVEETAGDNKNESNKTLEYTDYNALEGTELIRMVQLVLKDSGFDPGPIDGKLGPKTRAAIKRFQLKKELEPTGEIDKQTSEHLFWRF